MKPNLLVFSFFALFLFSAFNCKDAEDSSIPVNSDYQEVLTLVNEIRASGCNCGNMRMPAVGPLVWNDLLYKSAIGHTQYMERNGVLSHTGANRSSLSDRIDAVGYDWMAVGENIAVGYTSPKSVVDGWIKSVSHCKGIMNPDFKETGIARVGDYWCQDFGAR